MSPGGAGAPAAAGAHPAAAAPLAAATPPAAAPPAAANHPAARRVLALGAAGLGALAVVSGSPYAAQRAHVDVEELSRTISAEGDHVTALDLARWIKDRKPGLRVLDLRDQAAFDDYHVPSAERLDLTALAGARFQPGETVVLYSEGGGHAAQAWVLLRALGHREVYFLRGGLYDWVAEVMNPTLREGATEVEQKLFEDRAALGKYFGGTPRIGAPTPAGESLPVPKKKDDGGEGFTPKEDAVRRLKKRGC
jgi:rhodanese-related sulfurtransferase